MKKISLIIVDDEKSARDLLRSLLAEEPWITILGEAENVDQALPEIMKKSPDVILLDIQMPRKDGFVLVEKLIQHEIRVELIFITAFEKYAVRAIKAAAFDYLLKPVKKSELIGSLEKLAEKVRSERIDRRFEDLIYQLGDQHKIKFKNRTGFSMINPEDILYCTADSNYTVLELETGKSLVVSMNLGKVEELLPRTGFCRISRANIINMKYLTHVDRKGMRCTLSNEKNHTLSITKKYMTMLEMCCDHLFNS